MNFRTSSSAQMLLIKAQDQVIAWGGVDAVTRPAEIFSQFVQEDHRGRRLGPLLEAARLAYLAQQNVATAYCRLDATESDAGVQRRLKFGGWKLVEESPAIKGYAAKCQQCELYGDPCRRQRYFAIDVQRGLLTLDAQVGRVPIDALPLLFHSRAPLPAPGPGPAQDGLASTPIAAPLFTFERWRKG